MWPPLVVTILDNRGRNFLQTFLTKPFRIDSHAWFTEVLSSSVLLRRDWKATVLLCHVLQAKHLCKRQRLPIPRQIKPEASYPRSMLRRQAV